MRPLFINIALILSLSLLAACSDSFDTPGNILDRRILAIQADVPELTSATLPAGGSVTVHALVVEPHATAPSVGYEWGYCLVAATASANPAGGGGGGPGGGIQTSVRCDAANYQLVAQSSSAVLTQLMAVPTDIVALLNSGLNTVAPEWRTQLSVATTGDPIFAVKKVTVSTTNLTPNHNPSIDYIAFDNGSLPSGSDPQLSVRSLSLTHGACASGRMVAIDNGNGGTANVCSHDIAPVILPGDMETYTDYNRITGAMETKTERYTFAWYTDEGALKSETTTQPDPRMSLPYDQGVATEWREPVTKSGGLVHIWLVVRDGRGGVTWKTLEITLL